MGHRGSYLSVSWISVSQSGAIDRKNVCVLQCISSNKGFLRYGWVKSLQPAHVWLTDHWAFLFLMTIFLVFSSSMQNISNYTSHFLKEMCLYLTQRDVINSLFLFLTTLSLLGWRGGCWSLCQLYLGVGRVNPGMSHQINPRHWIVVLQQCSEGVVAPPPATRTPPRFCLGLEPKTVLNHPHL